MLDGEEDEGFGRGREGEGLPWTHCQTDDGADVAATADVEVAREEGGHVCACGDGVGGDVGAELGEGEGGGDDEDAEASGAVGGLAGVWVDEEVAEEVEGVPDWFAVDDAGGGGDDDADERGYGEADGDGDELGPESVFWLAGKTSEIRVVD